MWPELDPTPPRDADTLLPEVLRRGRRLRRQQKRLRQAGVLVRAAGVLAVAGLAAALARGTVDANVRTDVAAPERSTTSAGPSDDTDTATDPGSTPPTAGDDRPEPEPGSSTTVGVAGSREAPVVVLEVRGDDGRYHTAVLESGEVRPFAVTAATAERQSPVIAPDGRTIAFQQLQVHPLSGQSRWEVFVVDPDGTNLSQVTGGLLGDGVPALDPPFGPGTRWPSWAPDGTQLAFSCSGPTGLPQICAARADGSGRHPISLEGQGFYQPVWSPDGRTIAVKRDAAPGVVDLWLIDPAGVIAPRQLAARGLDARDLVVSWLSDGTLVYSAARQAAGVLQALDVSSGQAWTISVPGQVRLPIACGAGQVLYQSSGALVLAGTDGSSPTTVLPAEAHAEHLPASCAAR